MQDMNEFEPIKLPNDFNNLIDSIIAHYIDFKKVLDLYSAEDIDVSADIKKLNMYIERLKMIKSEYGGV